MIGTGWLILGLILILVGAWLFAESAIEWIEDVLEARQQRAQQEAEIAATLEAWGPEQ